jgi:hypothetical protein
MNNLIDIGFLNFSLLGNPEAGSCFIGVDSVDKHLKIKLPNGTVIDYQSGAVYADADAVAAFNEYFATRLFREADLDDEIYIRNSDNLSFNKTTKQSLIRQEVERLFMIASDFIGTVNGEFTSSVSGSGASHQNGTYGQDALSRAIGVTQSDTGTVSNGRAGLGTTSGCFSPTLARYVFEGRFAMEAISTDTENFFMAIGFGDFYSGSGLGNNGIYFYYNHLQNGGKWLVRVRQAGTEIWTVDTGISPDLNFHKFKIDLSEDAQTCLCYIDEELVASIEAPNLLNISNKVGAGFKIEKTVGTGQRNMNTDFMSIEVSRSAKR